MARVYPVYNFFAIQMWIYSSVFVKLSEHEKSAVIAQSVERSHGKAEVNSSILFNGSKSKP